MAYKKYITKNGKIYGPYVYHSRRINGKVVSEYYGSKKEEKTKKTFIFILGGAIILSLIVWTLFFQVQSTGRIILDIGGAFEDGQLTSGKINFILNQGELIPLDSIIIIENAKNTYEYPLKDLIPTQNTVSGKYYLEEQEIAGSGEGYGFIGTKEEFPAITFELNLTKKQPSTPSEGTGTEEPEYEPGEPISEPEEPIAEEPTNETIPIPEEPTNETIEPEQITNETEEQVPEEPTNETIEPEESSPEQPIPESENLIPEEVAPEPEEVESAPEPEVAEEPVAEEPKTEPEPEEELTPAPITGNAIMNIFSGVSSFITGLVVGEPEEIEIITGEVSKGEDFIYDLQNQEATIIPGSIQLNGEILPTQNLQITTTNEQVIITTNYTLSTQGFGEDYLGEPQEIQIDLSQLDIILKEGDFTIRLIHNETEIFFFEEEISQEYLDEIQTNKTELEKITDEIFNLTNQTINETFKPTQDFNLTEEEKDILKSRIAFPIIQTEVNSYRDRILVLFSIGDYTIEHSYPENLSNETLQSNIEKDRYLFLKDIINSFSKETPPEERIPELEIDYPII